MDVQYNDVVRLTDGSLLIVQDIAEFDDLIVGTSDGYKLRVFRAADILEIVG